MSPQHGKSRGVVGGRRSCACWVKPWAHSAGLGVGGSAGSGITDRTDTCLSISNRRINRLWNVASLLSTQEWGDSLMRSFSPAREASDIARIYRADELVPHSGIYKVTHGRGHLPQHTVTCVSGEPFPACNVCGRRVTFILVEAAHFIDRLQCFSLEPADSKAGLNWLDAPDEQGMFQSKFFWTKDRGGRSAELMELIGPSPLRLARVQVAPPRSTVSLRQNVRRLLECLI